VSKRDASRAGELVPPLEIDSGSIRPLSAGERTKIKEQYDRHLVRNQSLLEEVVFILREKIDEAGIKIHAIEHRLKTLDSTVDKCERKHLVDVENLIDVVGARIVCLFRSDISKVRKLVSENFEVVGVDDKVSTNTGPLGYMSVHYSCRIPSHYTGPRYSKTAGVTFEIQLRTLCMHAWAAVSHYLDYKGDWDVPEELKRSLSALSGLFYLADNQFEQFYDARQQSKEFAERGDVTRDEINLDTVDAYLKRRFSDRAQGGDFSSKLVQELKQAGYNSLTEVEALVDRAYPAFEAFEADHPPSGSPRFQAVGAVRLTLSILSDEFNALRMGKVASSSEFDKYRHLIVKSET